MQTKRPYRIGIVGADTSHVSAFVEYIIHDNRFRRRFEIAGVVDDQRGTRQFYNNRRSQILESLPKDIRVSNKMDLEGVDAWWILAGDAETHYDLLNNLPETHKPIFIDKPIAYSYNDFKRICQLTKDKDLRVYSSSTLRFASFMTHAYAHFDLADSIEIEGPLTFVDEIPGYHWYGIHCLEMVFVLSSEVTIERLEITDDEEYLYGTVSNKPFKIRWIKVGDPNFKIRLDNREFALNESLYEGLIHVLCEAIESDATPVSLDTTGRIMKALDQINDMRTEALEKLS